MCAIELLDNESVVLKTTIKWEPEEFDSMAVELIVTTQRILLKPMFELTYDGFWDLYYGKRTESKFLCLDKSKIDRVETSKTFFAKRMIIFLQNGKKIILNYGVLSVDNIVKAILDK